MPTNVGKIREIVIRQGLESVPPSFLAGLLRCLSAGMCVPKTAVIIVMIVMERGMMGACCGIC